MLGTHREDYDWQRGECAYLEDGAWSVEPNVHNGQRLRHESERAVESDCMRTIRRMVKAAAGSTRIRDPT